jgi:hypothetical protein
MGIGRLPCVLAVYRVCELFVVRMFYLEFRAVARIGWRPCRPVTFQGLSHEKSMPEYSLLGSVLIGDGLRVRRSRG